MRDQAFRPRKWRLASVALSGGTMAARTSIDTGWKTHPMHTGIDRCLIDQFPTVREVALEQPDAASTDRASNLELHPARASLRQTHGL